MLPPQMAVQLDVVLRRLSSSPYRHALVGIPLIVCLFLIFTVSQSGPTIETETVKTVRVATESDLQKRSGKFPPLLKEEKEEDEEKKEKEEVNFDQQAYRDDEPKAEDKKDVEVEAPNKDDAAERKANQQVNKEAIEDDDQQNAEVNVTSTETEVKPVLEKNVEEKIAEPIAPKQSKEVDVETSKKVEESEAEGKDVTEKKDEVAEPKSEASESEKNIEAVKSIQAGIAEITTLKTAELKDSGDDMADAPKTLKLDPTPIVEELPGSLNKAEKKGTDELDDTVSSANIIAAPVSTEAVPSLKKILEKKSESMKKKKTRNSTQRKESAEKEKTIDVEEDRLVL